MRFLVPAVLGLLVATVACGGSEGQNASPTVGNAESEPTATFEATAPPATRDEEWAREQLQPLVLEAVKALRDKRWNDLYDLYADPRCSRTEAVGAFAGAALLAEAFGAQEMYEAVIRDMEEGNWEISIVEATEDRIVWEEDGERNIAVRAHGKWLLEGDPCEDMETEPEASPGPEDEAQAEWDRLVDEWNQLSQGERDGYVQGDQISGFDNWMAQQGYDCATDDSGYSCTFESFSAQ